ncbi:hypothetical protein ElyMa_000622900 [Elysia marginata]|uniref:Uncharacterized protein n=1 Tax=Elysia marginata TaxID=1093978 RepID=A0AAV4G9G1_9GAST|nr:hypothetical protein ElyMa_000622900 [Elysia marginata]
MTSAYSVTTFLNSSWSWLEKAVAPKSGDVTESSNSSPWGASPVTITLQRHRPQFGPCPTSNYSRLLRENRYFYHRTHTDQALPSHRQEEQSPRTALQWHAFSDVGIGLSSRTGTATEVLAFRHRGPLVANWTKASEPPAADN